MKKVIFGILLFFISLTSKEIGYICVPVADLLLKPIMSKSAFVGLIDDNYQDISIAPQCGNYACPRAHQGLFNEEVAICQYEGEEVQIEIKNCFFDSAFYMEPQAKYWTKKSWIITKVELEEMGLSINAFPPSIDFHDKEFHEDVVMLFMPWHDPLTNITYSAGTRFVPEHEYDTENYSGIQLYDNRSKTIKKTIIPKDICFTKQLKNHDEQREAFVDILYLWAQNSCWSIPYVWGGASFLYRFDDRFDFVKEELNGEINYSWDRPSIEQRPYTGFDCSTLILRAAQIVGIPYFFKNATTVCNYLHSLRREDTLKPGDIIWTPGHVVVVGRLENNEYIEAAGYGSGFGKVHVVKLRDRYKGISTWEDFLEAYFTMKEITVLDRAGEFYAHINLYRILKLDTIWQAKQKRENNV